ncbi:MAG: helix-turn-helix domain-containing protein [Burkholderia contaminans]|uniref:helix-turn-helix domain-containing protein n=1 Tax=Burkholderia TaxID=32008 RepID=UPI00197C4FF4|nr:MULTISPECIES: helix-turn-helix domain-containing protein [Burkholderia]MBN3833664.1 helix-turn-helix domain-containing protein [Burkholderia sp. Ac-20344]
MTANATTKSAEKVLEVLNVLLGHFAHGLTPGELAKATSLSPSNITRYVATLEAMGFAERIPETGRIRPSVRFAQHAMAIARSLDAARNRLDELATRLATPR